MNVTVFLAFKSRRFIPFWGRLTAAASSVAFQHRDRKSYPDCRAQHPARPSLKLLGDQDLLRGKKWVGIFPGIWRRSCTVPSCGALLCRLHCSPAWLALRGQAGADAVRQVLRSGLLCRHVIMFRGISLMIPDSYWA